MVTFSSEKTGDGGAAGLLPPVALLSTLCKYAAMETLRERFVEKSHLGGLDTSEFLALLREHVATAPEWSSTCQSKSGRRLFAENCMDIFRQMDVRGDGRVSWDDYSSFILQLDVGFSDKVNLDRPKHYMPLAPVTSNSSPSSAAAGSNEAESTDVHRRALSAMKYLASPINLLSLTHQGSELVHGLSINPTRLDPAQNPAGLGLTTTSFTLRHDTAYKPHQVHAITHIQGKDLVLTSSSISASGPHFLTCWDLPTKEERKGSMQYLPALLQRKECAIPQTVLEWNSGMEMLLTASTAEGVLTAWTIQPLLAKTQIMLHTSGITCLSELVGVRGAGASHVLSAGHDGNLVVWGGETGCEDIITTVRAHEKGVYTTSQSETLVFTAGIYTVPMESSPDILVWKKDHHDGLSDRLHKRLEGHRRQVVGLSVADSLGHLISGDSGGKITVWSLPGLVKLQELGNRRKSVGSRLEGRLSHFALLPPLNGRSPMLVTAGHKRGLEFYVWTAKRLHEPLVCASYSSRMECFVTVSSRRIMRWDARTGMPVVTFEAGSLLGDPNIDITSFCIDSTGTRFVVGDDRGQISICSAFTGAHVKRLDPHTAMVSWMGIANNPADKCIFSSSTDGHFHVLDEADPDGFKAPHRSVLLRQIGFSEEDLGSDSHVSLDVAEALMEDRRRSSSRASQIENDRPGARSSISLANQQSGAAKRSSRHAMPMLGGGSQRRSTFSKAVSSQGGGGSTSTKPQFDVAAAATDAHLNLIATSLQVEKGTAGGDLCGFAKSTYIHVWDYEMCHLVGTCTFHPHHNLLSEQAGANASRAAFSTFKTLSICRLAFLSPYPILVGAASSGFVVLWKLPECECFHVIGPPASCQSARITCMAATDAASSDPLTLFVGTDAGDIWATTLSPDVLSRSGGRIPSRRRTNHNPYRVVRQRMGRDKILLDQRVSLAREVSRKAQPTQAMFHRHWNAHSDALSSITWMQAERTLLTASVDGTARIWTLPAVIYDAGAGSGVEEMLAGTLDLNSPGQSPWNYANNLETLETGGPPADDDAKLTQKNVPSFLTELKEQDRGASPEQEDITEQQRNWEGLTKIIEGQLTEIKVLQSDRNLRRTRSLEPKEGKHWKLAPSVVAAPGWGVCSNSDAGPDGRTVLAPSTLVPSRPGSAEEAPLPPLSRGNNGNVRRPQSRGLGFADFSSPSWASEPKITPSVKAVLAVSKGGRVAASRVPVRASNGHLQVGKALSLFRSQMEKEAVSSRALGEGRKEGKRPGRKSSVDTHSQTIMQLSHTFL